MGRVKQKVEYSKNCFVDFFEYSKNCFVDFSTLAGKIKTSILYPGLVWTSTLQSQGKIIVIYRTDGAQNIFRLG